MRKRSTRVTLLAAAALALWAASPAGAHDFTVTKRGDPAPGPCEHSDCSLREAVASADAHPGPDRVILPEAKRYQLSILGGSDPADPYTGDLDVRDGALTVLHPGKGRARIDYHPEEFTTGIDRIFDVEPGSPLTVRKLELTGGGDILDGGAIAAFEDVTLDRTVVRDNVAVGSGGGIYTGADASLELRHSVITHNKAQEGGGIEHDSSPGTTDSPLTVRHSTITHNRASNGDGGGLFLSPYLEPNAPPTQIVDTTIAHNRASADGGGIAATHGAVSLETSTVSGNRADESGGGISVSSQSHFELANSTVTGNRAVGGGGGVVADASAALDIYAATIARNRSNNITLGAGGLQVENGAYVSVGGSILAANLAYFVTPDPLASDCSGEPVASFGYNLLSTDACAGFNQESDVVARNPRLGQLGRHGGPTETIPLLPRSPALDAALDPEAKRAAGPFEMPKSDQRHHPRHDHIPDIGAFELNPGD